MIQFIWIHWIQWVCSTAGGALIGFGCAYTIRNRQLSFWTMIVGAFGWSFLLALYRG